MAESDLLFVYLSLLRPVLDFAVPAYHSLLTAAQSLQLERLQLKAMKIIYSHDTTYSQAIEKSGILSLEERRKELVLNFALKTTKNNRFADGWFPKQPPCTYNVRKQRVYKEFKARTERQKRNPIFYMRKILNQYHDEL